MPDRTDRRIAHAREIQARYLSEIAGQDAASDWPGLGSLGAAVRMLLEVIDAPAVPCSHARTRHRKERGTFDYTYEVCGDCGAERLQNEEGDAYGEWSGAPAAYPVVDVTSWPEAEDDPSPSVAAVSLDAAQSHARALRVIAGDLDTAANDLSGLGKYGLANSLWAEAAQCRARGRAMVDRAKEAQR